MEISCRQVAQTGFAESLVICSGPKISANTALHPALLAIPNPDSGRGHSYCIRKDVAAQIQLPARGMRQEVSQRRMKAARKQKWAEYRLVKESASGKPMRRLLRASHPVQLPRSR